MIRIKNLILLCINNSNIPVFHLFRFLKASCFLWSTIWLAINQLQLSTAFKCDCPVLSDLPSLSGRLGPSLSHIAAPPNCQSSERAFCALTKALSVSLWFVTPKRAFHGVLSQFFFFPICQDIQCRGRRSRDGERGKIVGWETGSFVAPVLRPVLALGWFLMKSFQFHIIHASTALPHPLVFFTLFAVEWSLQFFPCSPYFFTQKIVLSLCCWGYFNFAQMENNNQGKIIKWTQARKVQEIGKWVWGLTGRPRMSAKWGWQRERGPQYHVALFRVILNKAHCT